MFFILMDQLLEVVPFSQEHDQCLPYREKK